MLWLNTATLESFTSQELHAVLHAAISQSGMSSKSDVYMLLCLSYLNIWPHHNKRNIESWFMLAEESKAAHLCKPA
jgi:hypothetical protein